MASVVTVSGRFPDAEASLLSSFLVVFSLGAVLYLLSWVPALADLEVARRMPVYLLPHITPVVWLLALAWMGRSWLFAAASLVFVGLHTSHGVLAHRVLQPS